MRDFNFFLPFLGEKKESKFKFIYLVSVFLVIFIVIFGTLAWNSYTIFRLNRSIRSYKQELSSKEFQEKAKEAEVLSEKMDILKKYYSEVEAIYNSANRRTVVSADLMIDISSIIPKDISFKTISFDNTSIQIQGVAKNRVSIGELQYNLKNITSIKEVHVSSITGGDGGDKGSFSFSLKCILKDVGINETK